MRPKFDYAKLRARIRKRLGTLEEFAAVVGLSVAEIRAKLDNSADFSLPEIDRVCESLGIGDEEVGGVFWMLK